MDENHGVALNTDRTIWQEVEGDYYAPSIHVTAGGGVGINVGGTVCVLPIREWHRLAMEHFGPPPKPASPPSPEPVETEP